MPVQRLGKSLPSLGPFRLAEMADQVSRLIDQFRYAVIGMKPFLDTVTATYLYRSSLRLATLVCETLCRHSEILRQFALCVLHDVCSTTHCNSTQSSIQH